MAAPVILPKTKFTDLRKLLQKKYRTERNQFLVEGIRSIDEVLMADWHVELVLITQEALVEHGPLVQRIRERRVPLYSIPMKDLEKISDTDHSQGLLAVVRQKSMPAKFLDRLPSRSMVVVADDISEPGNVGTVIRTCDWFGVNAVVVSDRSVEVFNPKVVRSTMGSLFHVPIIQGARVEDILGQLKKNNYRVYATSSGEGNDVQRITWNERAVLAFGNEAHGLSAAAFRMADEIVNIPRFGKAESLNVGIACGIVLASWRLHSGLHP